MSMTLSPSAAAKQPGAPLTGTSGRHYQPGLCNIGPAEITRRRRAGHVGSIATVVVFLAIVALNVPPLARFVVALPAAGAASGYLQAALRFCTGFASRGIFNFGQLGQTEQVEDAADRRRDRSKANQIFLASLAIGLAVGLVAVLLPL
jgi:hypothetical protein